MIIHDVEQGTEEWLSLRLGIPTASEASKLVSGTGKLSESIKPYSRKLAAELYGAEIQHFTTPAMERGNELEQEARDAYSFEFELTKTCGFITTDDGLYGYSPDGLVGDDGLIEIKCVGLEKHLAFVDTDKAPTDYYSQCQAGLWVTGRKWIDNVLYYPGLPLFVKRIVPDLEFHEKLEAQAKKVIELRDEFLNTKLRRQ